MFKKLYKKIVPKELRLWFYKTRHKEEIIALRNRVHPSPKGDFSLAPFDEHKCIFIHITKTAGTSVALGLFGYLPYHYQAWQYRGFYGRKTYKEYFKFAFVRNPWDRLYSAFCYLKGGGWNDEDRIWAESNLQGIDDFNEFVLGWLNSERLKAHIHFWPQHEFICNRSGEPMIDYLAYFETISDDYQVVSSKISTSKELVHKNASKRFGYKDIYIPESIEKVASLYSKDIALFGYEFDSFDRKYVRNGKFTSGK